MFYITSLSGDEMVLYIWRWGERNKDLVYFYLVGLHTAKGWVKKQQNYTAKLLVRCCATMCCENSLLALAPTLMEVEHKKNSYKSSDGVEMHPAWI